MASELDVARTLLAVLVFLFAAHLGGWAFQRLRQPIVIGEIIGGIMLGPSLLGWLHRDLHQELFSSSSRIGIGLGMIYNFGFLLLMFLSGMEMTPRYDRSERRLTLALAVGATAIPLTFGFVATQHVDLTPYLGPAQSELALVLVFSIATAITSLPVIARIFMDLGIMETAFAKISLASAVLDDIVLYIVLAVALSLTSASADHGGLLSLLVGDLAFWPRVLCVAAFNLSFVALSLTLFRGVFRWLERTLLYVLLERSPIALLLFVAASVTTLALRLGVPMVLGALCAGLVANGMRGVQERDKAALKMFSFSFFIPIYFAYVGFRLDLVRDFEPVFFLVFLVVASAVKGLSVYVSARLGGASADLSKGLAVVLNARGGPGIVLAAVSLDAGIIDGRLYTSFVMLALVTSWIAGTWLAHSLRRDQTLIQPRSVSGLA